MIVRVGCWWVRFLTSAYLSLDVTPVHRVDCRCSGFLHPLVRVMFIFGHVGAFDAYLYHVCARAPICKSALSPELVVRIKFHMNTRSKLTVTVPIMSTACYKRFYFINSFLNAFSGRADGAKLWYWTFHKFSWVLLHLKTFSADTMLCSNILAGFQTPTIVTVETVSSTLLLSMSSGLLSLRRTLFTSAIH